MAKRKRDGEASSKSPKKAAVDTPPATIKVSSVLQPSYPPIIATSPGIEVPTNITFHTYARDRPASNGKASTDPFQSEFLLHSTDHPNLDYTAREEVESGSEPLVNHFLGIYDPKTGTMEVVQAKRMVIRATVRERQTAEEESVKGNPKQTMMERKTDLGQTFGTKKAKKAIEETAMNAISPQKRSNDASPFKADAASQAMLNSVGEITATMASREELQAVVDEAKPVPKPNLEAKQVEDVYDPQALIGSEILNLVPVREWQEKAQHRENISLVSRFVAQRVNRLAGDSEATTKLRVLSYMYFVLLFYMSAKPGKERGTRQLPPRDKLQEALQPAPEAVVENIRRKFSDAGVMRKFHTDLLMTHCCAFACIVSNFELDTQNLRDDLRLDQKTMNQYFHEIGGRVKPQSNKENGRTVHMGRLSLPLDFPKQRHLAPKRR